MKPKDKVLQPQKSLGSTVWRAVRWPIAIIGVLYFALVLYRIPAVGEQQRTTEAVATIASRKISMSDVLGTNLPPKPYEAENEATVAGIDKNGNHIRDDVELAIFAKYPNDPKIRAAELQYAMTEQMFLTEVFNTETWKAVAEQDGRASYCISETSPRPEISHVTFKVWSDLIDARTEEVENWIFNTQARKEAKDKAYTFITSNGSKPGNECDIDLDTL